MHKTDIENLRTKAVIVAPEVSPTGDALNAVVFCVLPWWLDRHPGKLALPGGKLKPGHFEQKVQRDKILDPEYPIHENIIIEVALQRLYLYLIEQLGISYSQFLPQGLLYLGRSESTFPTPIRTYAFLGQLEEKQILRVQAESAGMIWMNERELNGNQTTQLAKKFIPGEWGFASQGLRQVHDRKSA